MTRKYLGPFLLVHLSLYAVGSSRCGGAETILRWKFTEGQVLRQSVESETLSTVKFGGGEQKVSQKIRIDLRLTVKRVGQEGAAEIVQTCDHLVMSMVMPGGQSFEYDSKKRKALKGPMGEALGPLLAALSDAETGLTLTSAGKVENLKFSADLLEKLRSSPGAAGLGELFGEESLRRLSSPFPSLEIGPLSIGKEWSDTRVLKLPFGTLQFDSTYTYRGTETKEGRELHRITVKTSPRLQKDAERPVDFSLKPGESAGTLYFDLDAGRFVDLSQAQTLTVLIGGQGEGVESVTESKTRCRLDEAPKAEAGKPAEGAKPKGK